MDTYGYLLLSTLYLLPSLLIFFKRPDLRKLMLMGGSAGALLFLLAEPWFYDNYWSPPTIVGDGPFLIEDVVFGLGAGSLAAVSYKYLANKTSSQRVNQNAARDMAIGLVLGLSLMALFRNVFDMNSIFAGLLSLFIFTSILLIKRTDLLKMSVVTAAVLGAVACVVYLIVDLVYPGYFENYFLLSDKGYNPTILGFMPLLELAWYALWGALGSLLYDYFRGSKLEDFKK